MTLADLAHVLPPTATVTADGHLAIGGCDLVELAATHGTPLYVYDEAGLVDRITEYRDAFAPTGATVVYASKAFACTALARLCADAGIWIDVSTGGELAVALAGGMPGDRILMHGNNKSDDELDAALAAGVGRIVLDSLDEIDRLEAAAARHDRDRFDPVEVFVRITPGVDAVTHAFIRTGQEDSKFGFGLRTGAARDAVARVAAAPALHLAGLHCHIGSQLFDLAAFGDAVELLVQFCVEAAALTGEPVAELDLGGGLGIAYLATHRATAVADWAKLLHDAVQDHCAAHGLAVPHLYVEPGRSLVGRNGLTLYRVGTVKHIPGVRTYAAVDGGMSDNLRTALYEAEYETLLADRPDAPRTRVVHVAGKHCESGDIVVHDARLPADLAVGDLLVTPATGAYGHAMANNYNMMPRPAVVFCAQGNARVVVRRETIDDLMRLMQP